MPIMFRIIFFSLSVLACSPALAVTCALDTSPGNHLSAFETADGTQRLFIYQLPPGYVQGSGTTYPVVFNFHGAGQSAVSYATRPGQLDLRAIANSAGEEFIVVYPQGSSGSAVTVSDCLSISVNDFVPAAWNADYCCISGNDDQFTEELVTHIETGLDVDSTHMYMVGYSNGGIFTHRAAALLSEKIAAFASVSATAGGQKRLAISIPPAPPTELWSNFITPPAPFNPMPLMTVNNALDPTVPFNGGGTSVDRRHMSNEASWLFWYGANRCDISTVNISNITTAVITYEQQTHSCNLSAPMTMKRIIIADMLPAGSDNRDHYWPTLAVDGYDTSREIVDFLWNFSR